MSCNHSQLFIEFPFEQNFKGEYNILYQTLFYKVTGQEHCYNNLLILLNLNNKRCLVKRQMEPQTKQYCHNKSHKRKPTTKCGLVQSAN